MSQNGKTAFTRYDKNVDWTRVVKQGIEGHSAK